MQDLLKRKQEIEKQLQAFTYPLRPLQVIQKEKLETELKEIKYKLFILKIKEGKTNND